MKDNLKIAIVDDNKIFRAGLRFFIETNTNWEISCEASSGNEFIEKRCMNIPNIVFMDINMPGLDGLQTASHYISKYPHHNIKVIAITMHCSQLLLQSLKEHGFMDCVLKKDVYTELIPTVEKAIAG